MTPQRLFFTLAWFFSVAAAYSQTGQMNGRVETPDAQPIGAANVTLQSSGGGTGYHVTALSASDGSFLIPLNWSDVNAAIEAGATWSVTAEKEGYTRKQLTVILADGRVEPGFIVIRLSANPYEKYFSLVDGCPRSKSGGVTIYVFDLKAVQLDPQTAGTIPEWLADKLDKGVRTHLESYKLLGNLGIQVKICGSFPVNTAEAAMTFGQRLGSPAVLWGDVVGSGGSGITARLKFTVLLDDPVTDIASIRYSNIDSLYEPWASVHKSYFALASFVLGKIHLQNKETSLALRCFYHARELNALPPEMSNSLAAILARLEQSNIASSLEPIR